MLPQQWGAWKIFSFFFAFSFVIAAAILYPTARHLRSSLKRLRSFFFCSQNCTFVSSDQGKGQNFIEKKQSSPGNGNPLSLSLSLYLSVIDFCCEHFWPKWHARKVLLHAQSFSEPARRRIPTVADYVIFLTTLYDIIFWWGLYTCNLFFSKFQLNLFLFFFPNFSWTFFFFLFSKFQWRNFEELVYWWFCIIFSRLIESVVQSSLDNSKDNSKDNSRDNS